MLLHVCNTIHVVPCKTIIIKFCRMCINNNIINRYGRVTLDVVCENPSVVFVLIMSIMKNVMSRICLYTCTYNCASFVGYKNDIKMCAY